MRKILFFVLLFPALGFGQAKYFVYLKDKTGTTHSVSTPNTFLSERSISRRSNQGIAITERDLPLSSTYLSQISGLGFSIIGKSKWLNAVLVAGSSTKYNDLLALSCVSGIEGNADIRGAASNNANVRIRDTKLDIISTPNYGVSLTQNQMIGADTMHAAGYLGEGILVAVMDGGFPNVNTADAFAHLRSANKIVKTYNYVHSTTDVYRDNPHGTNVLSIIAGNLPGKLIGTAPNVSVALYTTEDTPTETRIEEVYWALAAEDADSLGVDVINTSLGYSTFDNPSQNYTYADMDGQTTIITRAANYATQTGMIVVNSAGNEGNDAWHYITAPSDAENVISIGAVNASKNIAAFSSFGPSSDGRVKPDVCAMGVATILSNSGSRAYGGNGTSYSGPVIAGFMASLKSQFPHLTALQLRDVLLRSADRYSNPNDSYGYGIPSYTRASDIIEREYYPLGNEKCCLQASTFPNPIYNNSDLNLKVNGETLSRSTIITLFNQQGAIVVENTPLNTLQTENLASGIYLLKFEYQGTVYTKKMSVMN